MKERRRRTVCAGASRYTARFPDNRSAPMTLRFLFQLALTCAVPLAVAQATLKPVPLPDLSSVPAETAAELRQTRSDFDKTRDILTGEALAENYGMLGSAYARAGFTAAAIVALDDAIVIAPQDTRWGYARGVLALSTGDQAEATRQFERAFAISDRYLPLRTALADRKLGAGDLDGARRLLEAYTAKNRDQAVPYAMLGDIALRQRRYADAIRELNDALRLQPEATRLYAQLSTAYAANGNAREAAEAKAKAGEAAPILADPVASRLLPVAATAAAVDPQQQAMRTAMAALASGDFAAGRAALDGALGRTPKDATLLAIYARLELAAGRLDPARTRADAAVGADPKNPLAHLAQGAVLEERGDLIAAERAYGEAIRLDPAATSPRLALAEVLLRRGRNDAALEQYRAVITTEPANPAAWTRRVALEAAAGRCADALKAVNGALAKDAKNAYLLQLFVRLASTCALSDAAEKRMALDYAGKLYQGLGDSPTVAEAYALALAANGKWDEAVATQEGAMFGVLRSGGEAALPPYREFLALFRAHRQPDRPWPPSSEVYRPARVASQTPGR